MQVTLQWSSVGVNQPEMWFVTLWMCFFHYSYAIVLNCAFLHTFRRHECWHKDFSAVTGTFLIMYFPGQKWILVIVACCKWVEYRNFQPLWYSPDRIWIYFDIETIYFVKEKRNTWNEKFVAHSNINSSESPRNQTQRRVPNSTDWLQDIIGNAMALRGIRI